ncbi:unnamed protein product [Rhizophagus irregularis]|uniref:Uncharacterized protein n=1 Tax=Rhizophagus irregularis TaxID=588596 RepID=A0A2N1N698_9GLOM|nr:hypothetical protein RhiirC2_781057 [Rhizophagus irregularis]CAB4391034.1 unnamed protein product [Rhizophagus irregularis]CAB5362961.1 unnamed protein product [Rhizophagus irregularis]
MARPEYSFSSLSSIAAIFYLIFYKSDYQVLEESPILKPFNEVLEFTKFCFNLHSIKLTEDSYKSYIYEFIFSKIIILYDSIIILIIYVLIILPYILVFALSLTTIMEIIISLISSIYTTCRLYENSLNGFKNNSNYILKIFHFITILCTPFVLIFWMMILVIYTILYKFVWISAVANAFLKIFSIYKKNGFNNVTISYLIIIIKIFQTLYNFISDSLSLSCIDIELDELIYLNFGIDIDKFGKDTLYEADNVINLLTLFFY